MGAAIFSHTCTRTTEPAQQTSITLSMYCNWRISGKRTMGICIWRHDRGVDDIVRRLRTWRYTTTGVSTWSKNCTQMHLSSHKPCPRTGRSHVDDNRDIDHGDVEEQQHAARPAQPPPPPQPRHRHPPLHPVSPSASSAPRCHHPRAQNLTLRGAPSPC